MSSRHCSPLQSSGKGGLTAQQAGMIRSKSPIGPACRDLAPRTAPHVAANFLHESGRTILLGRELQRE